MHRRIAVAAVLALVLAASPFRAWLLRPGPPRGRCVPEGRGEVPRHFLGCAGDPGPARALAADERLVLGLPLDPNTAGARELAFVPGLSRRLASEIVADRERRGAYRDVAELLRVRGIGPKRLAAAAPHLGVDPGTVDRGVASDPHVE
jgi:competence protein ComEA